MGIKCPKCGSPMWTVATGKAETHPAIVRRRACQKKKCGHRLTFYEMRGEDFLAMRKELSDLRKKFRKKIKKQPVKIVTSTTKLTAYAERLLNK